MRLSENLKLLINATDSFSKSSLIPFFNACCLWIDESKFLKSDFSPEVYPDPYLPVKLSMVIKSNFFSDISSWWIDLLPNLYRKEMIVGLDLQTPSLEDICCIQDAPNFTEIGLGIPNIVLRNPLVQLIDSMSLLDAKKILEIDSSNLVNKAKKIDTIFKQLEELDCKFINDLQYLYNNITKRGAQMKKCGTKSEMLLEYDYTERVLDHNILSIIQDNRVSSDAYYDTDMVDSLTCVSALKLLKAVFFIEKTADENSIRFFIPYFYTALHLIDSGLHSFPPCEQIINQLVAAIGILSIMYRAFFTIECSRNRENIRLT